LNGPQIDIHWLSDFTAAAQVQSRPAASIVPGALKTNPQLTVVAAGVLALESLVFIGVHVKYHETTPIIMSGVLGVLMAFIAYGRLVLQPIA
jgi:hypothetical protein